VAPVRSAPVRSELERSAPVKSAPARMALLKREPLALARANFALERSPFAKLTPPTLAPVRSAPTRIAWVRLADCRLACRRLAPVRSACDSTAWPSCHCRSGANLGHRRVGRHHNRIGCHEDSFDVRTNSRAILFGAWRGHQGWLSRFGGSL